MFEILVKTLSILSALYLINQSDTMNTSEFKIELPQILIFFKDVLLTVFVTLTKPFIH